ncbi:MAG: hypothetical protein LBT27_02505, partial [Prevotellaceae bacterium]|nr:hypothetical protein [Prevotellaceae bacterium]
KIGNEYDRIVFCYADVEIDLFNNFTNKSVYSDEFSQKGGSTTFDRAGREAFEEAASGIAEKIMNWIKN